MSRLTFTLPAENFSAPRSAGPTAGGAVNVTCTNSGAYTILVHSSGYDATTTYSLDLQTATGGGCNATPIACGQNANGNISQNAEIDAYVISGCSGELVLISVGGLVVRGSTFTIQPATCCSALAQARPPNITLSISGSYTLLVHSGSYEGTGSYSASLTCLIGACSETISTTFPHQRPAARPAVVAHSPAAPP